MTWLRQNRKHTLFIVALLLLTAIALFLTAATVLHNAYQLAITPQPSPGF